MRFKGLWAAGLALALGFPAAAHPYDLAQLLAMPIERLLQLKITSRAFTQYTRELSPPPAGGAIDGASDAL